MCRLTTGNGEFTQIKYVVAVLRESYLYDTALQVVPELLDPQKWR